VRDKKYPTTDATRSTPGALTEPHVPYVNAPWLEEKVWADVRWFLENPGEVLERVREQMESDDASAELETRHADLTDRLAAKHKERDRWLRLYAQGHISDAELELVG
jgi:hypothetical protein